MLVIFVYKSNKQKSLYNYLISFSISYRFIKSLKPDCLEKLFNKSCISTYKTSNIGYVILQLFSGFIINYVNYMHDKRF